MEQQHIAEFSAPTVAVSITGQLVGAYLTNDDVTELHISRAMENGQRDFFVVCANSIFERAVSVGEDITVRADARTFPMLTDARTGDFELQTYYFGQAVSQNH